MSPARTPFVALAALVLLGAAALMANRELPLVRNSLVYASASRHVIEHHFDPRPVVADSKLSYDKPILYAWASAPLVSRLGAHDGLRATSFLGGIAYLLAALYFARSFRALLPEGGPAIVLVLAGLGPCVVYQFWSAHPDGWFAAAVVLAWGLAQRIATAPSSPTRPAPNVARLLALAAIVYVSILLKNYGLVLLVSLPLYFACRARETRAAGAASKRLFVLGLALLAVLAGLVLLAWTGHHPFSRLEGEGGGVGQYGRGVLATSAKGTWIAVGLALLLQFHVALVPGLRPSAWRGGLVAPLLVFGGVYIVGLMPFPTTFYNMRYFLPLFPLFALGIVRGAASFPTGVRRTLFVSHAVLGAALVVVFNLEPAYRAAEPAIPALEVDWIGTRLSLLDNLRMKLHLESQAVLDTIDREVPPGAVLYMMDCNYYGDAQYGVFERDKRIRSDIETRYVSGRGFRPTEETSYVWCFRPNASALESVGAVTDFGHSIYRVDPR